MLPGLGDRALQHFMVGDIVRFRPGVRAWQSRRTFRVRDISSNGNLGLYNNVYGTSTIASPVEVNLVEI